MDVAQLLSTKDGGDFDLDRWTIQPYASVYDAIRAMSDGNVGALVVTDGDKPVGIVSERDYARKGILRRRFALDTLVADIMSTPLVSISPQDSVTTCMERMVGHEIRHLPVMDGERLVGMLSISDLLEAVLEETLQRSGTSRRRA